MRLPYLLTLAVVVLAAVVERLNGRVWICTCGVRLQVIVNHALPSIESPED